MNTKNIIIVIAILIVGLLFINSNDSETTQDMSGIKSSEISVIPISHATFVLDWGGITIYNDPVGGASSFKEQSGPDLVLLSDIHGDHLDLDTLESVVVPDTIVIAPKAVVDMMAEKRLVDQTKILANGENMVEKGISITAIPMYNLPESPDSRHTKGRGNGYVLEKDGIRVYVAGDTADIPEMRALKDIDIAFVPMNLPFTMTVESAADAVLEFKPKKVYPYHYRGSGGMSDIAKFKEIVNSGNNDIEVILLDWYKAQ